jgi:protein ImuB
VNNRPSGNRRYLALFFPFLSADRWRLSGVQGKTEPGLVLIEKQRGAMRVMAVDAAAGAHGIAPGTALADARARVPGLLTAAFDPAADAALLARMAERCDRYTPAVALDPPSGLILDITGCVHLWGGEDALTAAITAQIAAGGFAVLHALAPTPDRARALARYGDAPLPVATLGLDDRRLSALRRAGLYTIADIAERPRAPLAARFGAQTVAKLARILGEEDIRITPHRPVPPLFLWRRFAEPLSRTDDVLAVLHDLSSEAATVLSERGQGGRRFSISLFRSDGDVRRLAVETGASTRDPALLLRLFRERIDSLSDPLDPGFGYDSIRFDVPVCEALDTAQQGLADTQKNADVDALIDRLSVRMGAQRVRRFASADSHIPECAAYTTAASTPALPLPWVQVEPGDPPLRPLHLFDPPQRVEVIAEVPDGPPRRFRWRRVTHDVVAHEGPERIAAEWWKRRGGGMIGGASSGGLTRDYYRVENRQGQRFWLFRHGLYGSERPNPDWYLHGAFV